MKRFTSFNHSAQQRICNDFVNRQERDKAYIADLEAYLHELQHLLKEHDIEAPTPPEKPSMEESKRTERPEKSRNTHFMQDSSPEELKKVLDRLKDKIQLLEVKVQFRGLTFWNMASTTKIETVGSYATGLLNMLLRPNNKYRVDILKDLTGRIKPHALTLVMGPPGCGKSVLLKLLAGQFNKHGGQVEGSILYNGQSTESGNFLLPKVVDYIDEKDVHAPTLTVRETADFAWMMTSGGHHSYAFAKDEESAAQLDLDDKDKVKLQNILKFLGIAHVENTIVGDGMLRGVSGGQKRRVTVAEMLLPPRMVKFMDSISTGLDSSTTFDIIRSLKFASSLLGFTGVISLLQPAPEVFELFDELILLDQGQIIYHGPIQDVVSYFEELGYFCPTDMDVADFLQELPTPEGRRFMREHLPSQTSANTASSNEDKTGDDDNSKDDAEEGFEPQKLAEHRDTSISGDHLRDGAITKNVPRGANALAAAWKSSTLYMCMLEEMEESCRGEFKDHEWPAVFRERYAGDFLFMFQQVFSRQLKVTLRDVNFLKGRLAQAVVVGAIAGSLFSDIGDDDVQTMAGILFFSALNSSLASMSMFPIVYSLRQVLNKHTKALFYPAQISVICQSLVLLPLVLLETILFSIIVYWSVGLSDDNNGGDFFTFVIILFVQGMASAQLFTLIASVVPLPVLANPIAGVITVLMVLFSGYIIPADDIPPGWIWFFWINPIAYSLQGFFINELTSSEWDDDICTKFKVEPYIGLVCAKEERFGDETLDSYGYPQERAWIWYGVAVVIGEYFLFLLLTGMALEYFQTELKPPPPEFIDVSEIDNNISTDVSKENYVVINSELENDADITKDGDMEPSPSTSFEFEPVTLSFENVWYTVTLPSGEELDLLKGVSGFFEPNTLTALMGTSGAGKTTLLDVLAGRKNTGVIQGLISVNGKKKDDEEFRHLMGYVEQFDTLSPNDTAREAIEFSAALRLPRGTDAATRSKWVENVISMLELEPLESRLCATMSFEQRKRVSIGLELAANPAILFLDEPTSGLDSRASQVVVRCIQRVAATGRSIVCTIHQPSKFIFDAFDSLLLLRRGGETVYFGELGDSSEKLISHFESVPGVEPMPARSNAASWMLDALGTGTSSSGMDFHEFYKSSSLCNANTLRVSAMCHTDDDDGAEVADEKETMFPLMRSVSKLVYFTPGESKRFNASYFEQFRLLMWRCLLNYWRSPTYNFVRMVISVVIALIFSSTYADDKYSTSQDVISRVALIYITVLFLGVVAMMTVQTVVFADRPAFYREKFSDLYDVKLYALAATLVEIPYLIFSTVLFLIPYFFIVGFNQDGTAQKFFFYWLYVILYVTVCVFIGNALACGTPDEATAQVLSGMMSTLISLFSGFMIRPDDMPTFWVFMYWLDPQHYALEGLVVTQFNRDDTKITELGSPEEITASTFIAEYFEDWEYKNRVLDAIALIIFIAVLRLISYLFLEYVRHDKR